MKKIIVIPQGEQYAKYVEIGFLIDQSCAITVGEEHIHLVTVKPTTRTDIYIAELRYSCITIAVDAYGIEDLPSILKQLKSISGYTLLTKYHHVADGFFKYFRINISLLNPNVY